MIVLHHTAGSYPGDYNTLWGAAQVSVHAYITKAGTIYLGVPLGKRAWHAGRSRWNGLSDINSYSIGIELENWGDHKDPYPPEQLEALDYLIVTIIRPQFGNLPITRHRDISLEGKIDPSDNFPWQLYSGGTSQVTERLTVTGEELMPGYFRENLEAAKRKERDDLVVVTTFHDHTDGFADWLNVCPTVPCAISVHPAGERSKVLYASQHSPVNPCNLPLKGHKGFIEIHCTDTAATFERSGTYR